MLTRVIRPSTTAEAASLDIPPRQPVVHLRRLRCADEEPLAIESTVLLGSCADAVMTADLARGSLHETLGRAGIVLQRGTGTIAAAAATAEDARLLAIRTGDPLLVERRVITDERGRPIEATESRYAADRYALAIAFEVEAPDRAHDGLDSMSREVAGVSRTPRPRRPGRARPDRDRGRLDRATVEPVDGGSGRTRRAGDRGRCRTSRPGSSTSTSTAGAATTRWAARCARRDGPPPAAARGHRVPADGRDRAAAGPRDVRRDGPGLAAGRPGRRRGAARVQPRRARSSPRRAAARTTRPTSGPRPTWTGATSSRSSTACA